MNTVVFPLFKYIHIHSTLAIFLKFDIFSQEQRSATQGCQVCTTKPAKLLIKINPITAKISQKAFWGVSNVPGYFLRASG